MHRPKLQHEPPAKVLCIAASFSEGPRTSQPQHFHPPVFRPQGYVYDGRDCRGSKRRDLENVGSEEVWEPQYLSPTPGDPGSIAAYTVGAPA